VLARGGKIFKNKILAPTAIFYLDPNYSQTNHFWPSWQGIPPKNGIKLYGLFVTCFLSLPSPSRGHHQTSYIPTSGHYPLLTLTLIINLLLTATVSASCHPSKLYLRSILLSNPTIAKPFYQTFHIHLGPVHTFRGQVPQSLSTFRSVKPFFPLCLPQPYTFWPSENHAARG
jgi:hypothetical protein